MRSLSIVPPKDLLQWDCEHTHEVERMSHLEHSKENIHARFEGKGAGCQQIEQNIEGKGLKKNESTKE